jgi:hypothetical protein
MSYDINSLPDAMAGKGAEGPGLTVTKEAQLPKVDLKDLVGQSIGVIGFLILPSKFTNPGEEQKDYVVIEVATDDGQHVICTTQSGVIMQQLRDNYDGNNFPFRSVLQHKMNQSGTYKYYTFAA